MSIVVLGGVIVLAALAGFGRALVARPQRGVLALAALAPFDGLLVLLDTPGLLAGWKEALTLATLGATWLAPDHSRRSQPSPTPAYIGPLLGLAALGVASLLWAPPAFVLMGLKIDFFYVLVWLALWRCPLDRPERDRLVTILMVGAVTTAAIGLAQQRIGAFGLRDLGYEFESTIRTTGDSVLRSFSTFDLPFAFAFYLAFVLALATPVALAAPSRLRNRLFLASSPLLVVAMLGTFVRAAVAALVVGAAFLVIRRFRVILWLAPFALLGVALSPSVLVSATLSTSSLEDRVDGWSAVWTGVLDRPLGSGLGTTGAAAERLTDNGTEAPETFGLPAERESYQPDNYYMKRLLELGLPGLWLTLAMMRHILGSMLRIRSRADPADTAFVDGAMAWFLGAIIAALAATYWEIFPLDLYLWITLGALTSIEPSGSSAAGWPSGPTAAGSRPIFATS